MRSVGKMTIETDVKYPRPIVSGTWEYHLNIARQAASEAGEAITSQFGCRTITAYKGVHDVQLEADITAQRVILARLGREFPDCGIVAEEGSYKKWPQDKLAWAVDPLDGSNNFAYGIAHCAIAISLFHGDSVVLALVWDPLTEREFSATEGWPVTTDVSRDIGLERATISLVTNYSPDNHTWGSRFIDWLGGRCKRVTSLWAPALDLALVASGSLDAMVCYEADLLDVCGGAFLVKASGGKILGFDGRPIEIRRSMHELPVSFVAARSARLAGELVESLDRFQTEGG